MITAISDESFWTWFTRILDHLQLNLIEGMDMHPKLLASLMWQAGCRVHKIFDKDPGTLGRCFPGSDLKTMARIPGGCFCLGRDAVKSSVQSLHWLDPYGKLAQLWACWNTRPKMYSTLNHLFLNQGFLSPFVWGPNLNTSGNLKDPRHAGLKCLRRHSTFRRGQKPNGHWDIINKQIIPTKYCKIIGQPN